jgi:hypothetical protein
VEPSLAGTAALLEGRTFDVIVIDGLNRLACAWRALELLGPAGAIIFDNSDGNWGGGQGAYPILELFRENGYSRVDFYGHTPGVIAPHCTSLFFRDGCFLLSGEENTVRMSPALKNDGHEAKSNRQPALSTA